MTVNQRLKEYFESKNILAPAFYKQIGINRTVWSGWINTAKAINALQLQAILLAYPDLNARWLLTGEGKMIIYGESDKAIYPESNKQNQSSEPGITHFSCPDCIEKERTIQAQKKTIETQDKLIAALEGSHQGKNGKAVIRAEDPQLFLGAMLQYFCFVRPGDELLKLKLNQVNLAARTIHIPKNTAKKRKERTVDIPEQMYKILVDQGIQVYGKDMYLISKFGRPGIQPIGYNTLRNRFNKYRDQLGMTDLYKWYSFKHTGAGKLLESGATIIEIMNQLGHTDIASTYRYIRRHFGDRSQHVRTKFPDPPGFVPTTTISEEFEFCI